jgi:hypothetical protein
MPERLPTTTRSRKTHSSAIRARFWRNITCGAWVLYWPVPHWLLSDLLRGEWGNIWALIINWYTVGRMVWAQQVPPADVHAGAAADAAVNAANNMIMTTPRSLEGVDSCRT